MKSTGFPDHVRQLVRQRADDTCERCGEYHSDWQLHHRRPRGMGGTKREDTNTASGCLLLCGACHRWVESYRDVAYTNGWLVRSSKSPIAVPVLYRGRFVLLDDDGFTYPVFTGGEASEA